MSTGGGEIVRVGNFFEELKRMVPFADQDLRANELLAPSAGASSRHTERTPAPKARRKFPTQRTASLNIERLVNGLVRYSH